jgi:hypothetical protein
MELPPKCAVDAGEIWRAPFSSAVELPQTAEEFGTRGMSAEGERHINLFGTDNPIQKAL